MPVSMLNDTDDDRMKPCDRLLDEIDNSLDKLQAIRLQLLKENLYNSLGLFRVSDQHDCKENCIAEGEDDELSYEDNEYEDNHSTVDETETDDDVKACFPCPFCYLEIEVHMICSHLQEEHCFEMKNAVCPLCAANLGKDAAEHFIVQHTSSLKRRRKCLKSGFWNGGSAMLGKELSSFLGSPTIVRGNAPESLPDLLLSPFLCSGTLSDTKGIQKDDCTNAVSFASDLKSAGGTLLDDRHEEKNIEEKMQRATFVQQLIMSTIF